MNRCGRCDDLVSSIFNFNYRARESNLDFIDRVALSWDDVIDEINNKPINKITTEDLAQAIFKVGLHDSFQIDLNYLKHEFHSDGAATDEMIDEIDSLNLEEDIVFHYSPVLMGSYIEIVNHKELYKKYLNNPEQYCDCFHDFEYYTNFMISGYDGKEFNYDK